MKVKIIAAPLRMKSATKYLQFKKESFGALHQMLSSLDPTGREAAQNEITSALGSFEDDQARFVNQYELLIDIATK